MFTHQHTKTPDHVVVVGGGIVGLSAAWFLQERGVSVTVLDAAAPGSGASAGNAGWVTPALVGPLPEPSVLRYGVRALLDPASPLRIGQPLDVRTWAFMAAFALNCRPARWRRGVRAFAGITELALPAFREQTEGGVEAEVRDAHPLVAAYRTADDARHLVDELDAFGRLGRSVDHALLSGEEVRRLNPAASEVIGAGVAIAGQAFVDPLHYARALHRAIARRGGAVRQDVEVRDVTATSDGVLVDGVRYDAAVIANGAALPALARQHGVKVRLQAGRGYSLELVMKDEVTTPLYFPQQRIACTPLGDRTLRVAGIMEFHDAQAPASRRCGELLRSSVEPLLRGIEHVPQPTWVGARPCTPDGLPLIGETRSKRIYVAGGHGMWGVTLGPATGRLLADSIVQGSRHALLDPFDPLR